MNVWEAGLLPQLSKYLQNPADVLSIQEIYRCYTRDETVQRAVERKLLANPSFRGLYEEWYQPKEFSLDELIQKPPGTLGHEYAQFMIRNGLKLDFISDFEGRDVLSYLWCRAKHVHDITHLIVGFDTSFPGEAGVKGFELAQYLSPATAAILGGGLLGLAALKPEALGPMMDAVLAGYSLGQEYPLLMAIQWDQEWGTPMAELRSKYKLPAIQSNTRTS